MDQIKTTRRRRNVEVSPQNSEKIREVLTLLAGKPYTNEAQTNIRETFFKFGWIGPEEKKRFKQRGYIK